MIHRGITQGQRFLFRPTGKINCASGQSIAHRATAAKVSPMLPGATSPARLQPSSLTGTAAVGSAWHKLGAGCQQVPSNRANRHLPHTHQNRETAEGNYILTSSWENTDIFTGTLWSLSHKPSERHVHYFPLSRDEEKEANPAPRSLWLRSCNGASLSHWHQASGKPRLGGDCRF